MSTERRSQRYSLFVIEAWFEIPDFAQTVNLFNICASRDFLRYSVDHIA
jgi:hypothetical protein